jgi:hypothetical protein
MMLDKVNRKTRGATQYATKDATPETSDGLRAMWVETYWAARNATCAAQDAAQDAAEQAAKMTSERDMECVDKQ